MTIIKFLTVFLIGMVLGELFLGLCILDALRAKAVAQVTGTLTPIAPLAEFMSFVSKPIFEAAEDRFGQDPIAGFASLIVYWALIGAVLACLFLIIKSLFVAWWPKRKVQ